MRRLAGAILAVAAIAGGAPAGAATSLPDPLASPKAFSDPPAEARPKTRWWWAGPYEQKEFVEEIDAIAAAGFGGAEIAYNTDSWATQEQRDGLRTSLEAARRNGIRLDMTLGASWPVATPNTAPGTGLSEQELYYGRADVSGPSVFAGPVPRPGDDPGNSKGGKLIAATAARVLEYGPPVVAPAPGPNLGRPTAAPARSTMLDTESLVDLTGSVDANGALTWDVPAGQWIVFGIWQRDASEGVMDHLSAASARAVTQYIDEHQIGPAARGLLPQAASDFFEDSLELDVTEVMWTHDFAEQFRRRRGYDIAKFLPVIFVQGLHHYPVPDQMPPADFDLPDGVGERVRHDYLETVTDLYVDAHMVEFQRWAKTHGGRFRTQPAFGNAFDVTRSARALARAGGIADDESLNAGDPAPRGDTNWRYAFDHYRALVGGVRQGGGSEISSELGAMFFREYEVGLADHKAIMDKEWAAGITRPILHGFAYQPLEAGWPGRSNFAGIVADSWNHRHYPQWAMFRPLTDYWARGNLVLQQGRPRVDVAVYRDGFSTTAATFPALGTGVLNKQIDPLLPFGIFNTPDGGQPVDDTLRLKPTRFFDGEPLERAGYSFEYVDPNGLLDAGDDVLYPDGPGYRALVLDQRAVPGATADAIARAASRGLAVVLVGAPPDRGTGNRDRAAEDAQVRAAVGRVLRAPRVRRVDTQADARDALDDLGVEPVTRWPRPLPVYAHARTAGKADYFYLWNAGPTTVRFTPALRTSGVPRRLDLWTGEIAAVPLYRDAGDRVEVPLALAPGETAVLAFERGAQGGHLTATSAEEVVSRGGAAEVRDTRGGERTVRLSDTSERAVTIPDLPEPIVPAGWKLHVDEVDPDGVRPHDLELTALADWRSISAISRASGTGTYTTTLAVPRDWVAFDRGAYLELGRVGGAVQAFVNGRRVAPDVTTERRVDVSELLRAGDNELRVVVTTTLKNKIVGMNQSGRPAGGTAIVQPATQPYGLLGPVRLVPFGRGVVRLPAAARRCTSRRRMTIHVSAPRGFRPRSATVRAGSRTRRVRAVRVGRRVRVVADLRGLRAGRVRVRVTVRGSRGRVARTVRTYRLCVKRR